MKVWYLKHPTSKYYEGDVKSQAKEAGAKIIDIKFADGKESASDCPAVKGEEKPKKRGRKPKENTEEA